MTVVLYVARNKRNPSQYDLGSALCLRVLDLIPAELVELRDCDAMRDERPTWLTGTPTLVASSGGNVFRGHQALAQLQRIAVDAAERRGTPAKPASSTEATSARRNGTTMPNVQLRDERQSRGTAPAPAQQEGDEEEGLPADLWTSMGDYDNEDEDTSTRKITSDDLAKALRERDARQ